MLAKYYATDFIINMVCKNEYSNLSLIYNIYVGFALRLELELWAWNESLLALDVIIMQ